MGTQIAANHVLVRSIRIHDIDLVTAVTVAFALEDDLFAVGTPVRFTVVTGKCQLLNIG